MRENLTAAVLGERYRSSDVSKAISEFKEAITGQYRKDNLELLKDFGYMNGIDGMEKLGRRTDAELGKHNSGTFHAAVRQHVQLRCL